MGTGDTTGGSTGAIIGPRGDNTGVKWSGVQGRAMGTGEMRGASRRGGESAGESAGGCGRKTGEHGSGSKSVVFSRGGAALFCCIVDCIDGVGGNGGGMYSDGACGKGREDSGSKGCLDGGGSKGCLDGGGSKGRAGSARQGAVDGSGSKSDVDGSVGAVDDGQWGSEDGSDVFNEGELLGKVSIGRVMGCAA
eukprot:CAMPEP_0119309514 /NCGR_PEP_ID=MMETSP1333-20130426/15810_1 /TAXON_ID=418940 /ORGANISM="Scyphosphaera apsteinii, Strain RCC1455" /LENGTH=192 /DNA_ID=CAMNT_0007313503 /DNA_START=1209 /DNA_END=1787 /DNA_ORIENTATION=-